MTNEQCDLCSSADPLHLHAKCHNNAPLHATLEGGEIVLRCYVPSCLREVARYRIYQGFPEKFAMQNAIGNQAAEIARLQAELAAVREDAGRWKYVLKNHCRAGSPHMNNTWAYHFSGSLRGRWETPEQAVDAAIKELSK